MNMKRLMTSTLVLWTMVLGMFSGQVLASDESPLLKVEMAPKSLEVKSQALGLQITADGKMALMVSGKAATFTAQKLGIAGNLSGKMLILTGQLVDHSVGTALDSVEVAANVAVLTGAVAFELTKEVTLLGIESGRVLVVLTQEAFIQVGRYAKEGVVYVAKGAKAAIKAGQEAIELGAEKVAEAAILLAEASKLAAQEAYARAEELAAKGRELAVEGYELMKIGAAQLKAAGVYVKNGVVAGARLVAENAVRVADATVEVSKQAYQQVKRGAKFVASGAVSVAKATGQALKVGTVFVIDGLLITGETAVKAAAAIEQGTFFVIQKTQEGVLKTHQVFSAGFLKTIDGIRGLRGLIAGARTDQNDQN